MEKIKYGYIYFDFKGTKSKTDLRVLLSEKNKGNEEFNTLYYKRKVLDFLHLSKCETNLKNVKILATREK